MCTEEWWAETNVSVCLVGNYRSFLLLHLWFIAHFDALGDSKLILFFLTNTLGISFNFLQVLIIHFQNHPGHLNSNKVRNPSLNHASVLNCANPLRRFTEAQPSSWKQSTQKYR